MDVNLPVLESIESVLQVELVSERATISLETTFDFGALLLSEELSTTETSAWNFEKENKWQGHTFEDNR